MEIKLFISHSAKDTELAEKLVDLIRNSLNLKPPEIRCTSVDGYRLKGGANTIEQLREEVLESETFIGLISENSIQSMFVSFELGARWGINKYFLPVLAPNTSASILKGPLAIRNALRIDRRPELYQILDELGERLHLCPNSPQSTEKYVNSILELATSSKSIAQNNHFSDQLILSPLISQLSEFQSETSKIRHISDCMDSINKGIPFLEILSVLNLFKSDNSKLTVLKILLPFLEKPVESERLKLLSVFSSDNDKTNAIRIIHNHN